MRLSIFLCFMMISTTLVTAQKKTARWLQNPALSPDGETIGFGYNVNLYEVNSTGGTAVAITTGDAYYTHPVWSHDGKTLAFSSDRYGSFDVYTMPADGGKMTRITYHSAADYPYDFTADNQSVLIGSHRDAPAKS